MEANQAMSSIKSMYNALNVIATLNITAYLCPKEAVVKDGAEYDFIIIGTSGSGCVMASRLTEDKKTRVLLIEAGGFPPFETTLTNLSAYTVRPADLWDYNFKVDRNMQSFHENNVNMHKAARLLGGSSCINNYAYLRGDPHDYDFWANEVNDDSWSYKNVLPLFVKSEKLKDKVIYESDLKDYHGYDGYLGVTRQESPYVDKYIDAFKENNKIIADFNGDEINGYARPLLTLFDGVPQNAAYAFLTPIKDRPNLDVLMHHTAVKILIDDMKQARGVTVMDKNGNTFSVKAIKEIITAAGPVNTAKLLLLSGIGPEKHLKSKKIKVVSDLPVGQDNVVHQSIIPLFYITEKNLPFEPIDPHLFPVSFFAGRAALDKTQKKSDYQSLNYIMNRDAMLHYCLTYCNLKKSYCQYLYNQAKDREVMFSVLSKFRQKSRGAIELKSSNPKDGPIVTSGLMSDQKDVDNMVQYINHFNRIADSSFFKSVKSKLLKFPNGPKDEDEYWDYYIKGIVTSMNDISGGCPIGEVVDNDLLVRGVKGLRIGDESVVPTPIGGTVYINSVMIGEKVSEKLIKKYCKN